MPIPLFLALLALGGVATGTGFTGQVARDPAASRYDPKICFDLNRLDDRGLQGPRGGLRALHYEYCLPDRPEAVAAVTAIDPTLEIQRGAPGRIGCSSAELLCLGHTYQPDYSTVLRRLASLPAIRRICEAHFE
jgi:hypothetical protein